MVKDIPGFSVFTKSYNIFVIKIFRIILFIFLFSLFSIGVFFLLNTEIPKWAEPDFIFWPIFLFFVVLYFLIVRKIYKKCFKSKKSSL